jgi:Cu+-exporting ATPase
MGDFYRYEAQGGVKPRKERADQFQFLDLTEIRKRYIQFENAQQVRVTLSLPSIHCSSCIYLLENLHKIDARIRSTQVHFGRKEATLVFDPKMALSEVAKLLHYVGYEPDFGQSNTKKQRKKTFLFQLGIAGFAFGSIMLWSAPEYFGLGKENPGFRNFTAFLSFIVSIPVLFFSARDYFISAFKALRSKSINLDVPITIGILALYLQSTWQIISLQGPGYMDSFAGFIFFLLIGKWFQNRTYESMAFDRDFTSFFPVAVLRLIDDRQEIIPVEALHEGDEIHIRHEEIIPCDCILLSDSAYIDYSFVTGEAVPVKLEKGAFVYAGGQIQGVAARLKVEASSQRSHLTQLWNETKDKIPSHQLIRYQDRLAQYFLGLVLLIAAISSIAWYVIDAHQILKVIVSILIVACPCALALSAPFTLGNAMRLLGNSGLYLKNTSVVEALTSIDTVVFDKTGTLTDPSSYQVRVISDQLSDQDWTCFVAMARQSTHPLSRALSQVYAHLESCDLTHFNERKGLGIEAQFANQNYRLGSAIFCEEQSSGGSELFLKVDGRCAHLQFVSNFRTAEIQTILQQIGAANCHVLSGDDQRDKEALLTLGFIESQLHFKQSPQDKSDAIAAMKASGKQVLFIGDGLNDVGALGSAHVGVALSEDMFRFTPSSDAILDAKALRLLPQFLKIGRYSKNVLIVCLAFSLTYNSIGLAVAISAQLTPLFAAILMPISSITIVLISTLLLQFKFGTKLKN